MTTVEYAALVVTVRRDADGVDGRMPFSASLYKADIKDINRPKLLTWTLLAVGAVGNTLDEATETMPMSWRGLPRMDDVASANVVDAEKYNKALLEKLQEHVAAMLAIVDGDLNVPGTMQHDLNQTIANPIDPHDTL